MSNFYPTAFTAPHPASWLFGQHGLDSTPASSSTGDEAQTSITFHHSEQYYMYCKALYFGDDDAARTIVNTVSPTACKDVGRFVKGFSEKAWRKHELDVRVMKEALWWKFGGGQLKTLLEKPQRGLTGAEVNTAENRMNSLNDLGRRLLATGERQLLEAAGSDKYWGIGFSIKQGPHQYEKSWGRNLLGKTLIGVRERLRRLINGEEDEQE